MTSPTLDIAVNRASSKWTASEKFGRVLWALCRPIFALSPRPLWFIRRLLLRMFGASIGRRVHIYPSVRITIPWNLSIGDESAVGDRVILYALGKISIGARVTVSQGAHLCAGSHDYRDPARPLIKPPITIEDETWICADAFVGPNVTVGQRSIVGARSVVVGDVQPDSIYAGNPARLVRALAVANGEAGGDPTPSI